MSRQRVRPATPIANDTSRNQTRLPRQLPSEYGRARQGDRIATRITTGGGEAMQKRE